MVAYIKISTELVFTPYIVGVSKFRNHLNRQLNFILLVLTFKQKFSTSSFGLYSLALEYQLSYYTQFLRNLEGSNYK